MTRGLRRLTPSEHQTQCAFFQLVRAHFVRYPDLKYMRAFPNGALRHKAIAGQLTAEGVAPGPLDVVLPCRRGSYAGIWIEFKAYGRKMSPAQEDYARYLQNQQYFVVLCYSMEEAWRATKDYLALPMP